MASNDQTSNPWATAEPAADTTASDPWGSSTSADAGSFMSAGDMETDTRFSLANPFEHELIPLEGWVETFIDWLVGNFRPFFSMIKAPVDATLQAVDTSFNAVPPLLMILLLALLAWQLSGRKVAIGTLIGMTFIGAVGAWQEAMTTLSLVVTSVLFCMLVGIPAGIGMASSDPGSAYCPPYSRHHADHPGIRLSGTRGHAVRHWQRTRRGGHHYLCRRAGNTLNQPGHSPGSRRPYRGCQLVWRQQKPETF